MLNINFRPEFLGRMLCCGVMGAFLLGWHWVAVGMLSAGAVGSLLLTVVLCAGYGAWFSALIASAYRSPAATVFELLCGFFVFNTLLFILSLALPFGIKANMLILLPGAVYGLVAHSRNGPERHEGVIADTAVVAVSCLAATIWSMDALYSPLIEGEVAIFQVWRDFFIHAREISAFAQAHGVSTIHDIKQAGGAAPIYHFASYIAPAAISAFSGAAATEVYASFQLPFGVMLTGMAAYVLIASVFGRWPGVAAAIAIVLAPDAYLQGFENRYLSYYFLSQVNLGMLYGVACMAIAWVLIVEGCRTRQVRLVMLGYVFVALCLLYKAHIFVANSYIALLYPCLFFADLRRRVRVVAVLAVTFLFFAVVSASQSLPRVPVLKLDGSGLQWYIVWLLDHSDTGIFHTYFRQVFLVDPAPKVWQGIAAVAMILLSSFGLWNIGLVAALATRWSKIPPVYRWLPVFVIGNYLIMAMGLAPDERGIGTRDELMNRPAVWAYFIVAAFTTGAAYRFLIGDRWPVRLFQVVGVSALTIGALAWTLPHTHQFQTFPAGPYPSTYRLHSSLPVCGLRAASFLRLNSARNDIVQVADGDPDFKFTALSERQLYAGKLAFGGENAIQRERLESMQAFHSFTDESAIRQFAYAHRIGWYLLPPGSRVAWPSMLLEKPEFDCGGYRLFRFAGPADGKVWKVAPQ